jgi:hypothetical protein
MSRELYATNFPTPKHRLIHPPDIRSEDSGIRLVAVLSLAKQGVTIRDVGNIAIDAP